MDPDLKTIIELAGIIPAELATDAEVAMADRFWQLHREHRVKAANALRHWLANRRD